ncbi:unnamed protein product, partial [Brassica oleracea var. botrytis]
VLFFIGLCGIWPVLPILCPSRCPSPPQLLLRRSLSWPLCSYDCWLLLPLLDSHSIKKNDVSQSSYRKVICVSQLSFNSANPSFLTRTVFSNFQGTTLQRWVRPFSPDSEPGDRVEPDEAIAQIETDKVTIDIASPWCDPRVSCQGRRYCRTGKQGSHTK